MSACRCGCVERRQRRAQAIAFDCGFDSVTHRAAWAQVMRELKQPAVSVADRIRTALREMGALKRSELGQVIGYPLDHRTGVLYGMVRDGEILVVGRTSGCRYALASMVLPFQKQGAA